MNEKLKRIFYLNSTHMQFNKNDIFKHQKQRERENCFDLCYKIKVILLTSKKLSIKNDMKSSKFM